MVTRVQLYSLLCRRPNSVASTTISNSPPLRSVKRLCMWLLLLQIWVIPPKSHSPVRLGDVRYLGRLPSSSHARGGGRFLSTSSRWNQTFRGCSASSENACMPSSDPWTSLRTGWTTSKLFQPATTNAGRLKAEVEKCSSTKYLFEQWFDCGWCWWASLA